VKELIGFVVDAPGLRGRSERGEEHGHEQKDTGRDGFGGTLFIGTLPGK
jgi:hypothetical protein